MNRILVAVVSLLAVAGCASTGSAGSALDNPNADTSGTVTGIFALAQGVTAPANPCDGLDLAVTANGAKLGKVNLRQSRNRCAFEVSRLPVGSQVQLSVKPGSGITCANGGALKVSPESSEFTLKTNEFRTIDFRAQCG